MPNTEFWGIKSRIKSNLTWFHGEMGGWKPDKIKKSYENHNVKYTLEEGQSIVPKYNGTLLGKEKEQSIVISYNIDECKKSITKSGRSQVPNTTYCMILFI